MSVWELANHCASSQAPAGMGKGRGKCRKVIFVLHMLSKDEVFIHYFEKMLSASGGLASRPQPGLCLWT